ncbi:ABC transporter substrate-binding protein [Corynebacterium pseudotuberculosis]|uniref:ABC transporter substrate-binding protein n=1 Tax=Corynebacterium pseudotuberculosis (strain C231) TaxID=681645 RepID=D9QA84_CORP2|nr:ABC transporter substrate-binding protein [Corynebacterium pseudotuberculosis]ADL10460.1 ABC transporter substrate-binding protein [Corynebacterium pseudotuberculosis C231]ADO26255.2 ABC transporter substrate-binding protein [Corynebacterium pseudotuberculosis I19]AEK92313.1 Iron ABC transporter substrate-binding protein [Corynebacterium pseudotuberculosis PAT10]AFF22137.1 Iron ABC transporter substrate-binding protein [Corynebacterium pseudotuberculosis P54B96]AFH51926.1 Iron ABC transport
MQSKPNFLSMPWRNVLFAGFIAMMAIVALILGGCSTTNSTNSAGEGSKEAQQASAKRVVALDWRYEEILYALGVQPVGIVEIGKSKEPQTLKGKLGDATSVGQAKQPNLEVIQSLEPDLILASPTRQAGIMEQLKNIAPTEAYQDTSYVDVLDSMDSIAKILGKEDKAAEVRSRIESKIGTAKNKVAPGTRTALIGWSKNTLYTWVKDSFPGSLLTAVGYDYGFDGQKSAIESKTDVAELTGDKLPGMKLDVMYLYNDIEGFRASPYAGVVHKIVNVEQDTWSRSRGPLAAEAMLDQIISS